MRYSAQIVADYRKFVRMFGALMDIHEFARLFFERTEGISKSKVPKAMEDAFAQPQSVAEVQIRALIERFNAEQSSKLEQDLFKQRKRLADAERTLQTKVTKAAIESQRIATDKIAWTLRKLDDIRRTESQPRDSRIFPSHYAPVMVMKNGKHVVKPMRYQCRIAGKPASYDVKYPGTYNARRAILRGSGSRALDIRMVSCSSTSSTKTSARRNSRERFPRRTSEMKTSFWSFALATAN